MVGCSVFSLQELVCANGVRFLDQVLGSPVLGECRAACVSCSCISPLFRTILSMDLIGRQNPLWHNGIDGLGQDGKTDSLWIRKWVEGKKRVLLGLLSPRKWILHVLILPKERC